MKRDEQVVKNLDLAGRFLADLLDHPSQLAEIPEGAQVILIPANDQPLADANIQLAKETMQRKRVRRRRAVLLKPAPS